MAAFITRKKSVLVFLCALLSAAAAAVLLNHLLRGPKLGPHYDFLMNMRLPPPIDRNLLLVDTEAIIEPGSAIQLILTLIEMDAAALVIESPVLSFSSGREGGGEILYRFDEEFALLGRNIQNLFEAIRIGSVPPSESERYVTELVELANRGKERLTLALVQHDEAGMARMERAAAAFGKTFKAGDLRLPAPVDSPWYSRPRPDWDGRIRRIAPMLPGGEEHVVYAALKDRFKDSRISVAGETLAQTPLGEAETVCIPLDINGAILFEWPGKGEAFQRLPLDFFRQYGEADLNLQRLLKEADSLGIYSEIPPENSPLYLSEYALSMREEFLADRAGTSGTGEAEAGNAEGGRSGQGSAGREAKADWIRAREEYFSRLEEFLEGPSETSLVRGYEELVASEDLGEEGLARVTALRDELIGAFGKLRTAWEEFRDMRSFLGGTLASSFVILGPRQEFQAPSGGPPLLGGIFPERPLLSGPETSLVLANSLLTGRAIGPAESRRVLLASFLAALPVILIVLRLGPWGGLAAGCILISLVGAGFSWAFVLLGCWIDPLIPLGASLAAVLTVFSLSLVLVSRGARRFRLAYGPYVNKSCLKHLIATGRPALPERIPVKAAVITIREAGLLFREDRAEPLAGAAAVKEFRETAAQLVKKAGGVIVGCDGDTVQACFGSPLERIGAGPSQDPYAHYTRTPAVRAVEFIADIRATAPKAASWHFGIDTGECAFGYMPVSGYSAFGRPVVRSRILSGLTSRYKARTIISESVNGELRDIPVRKLNVLKEQDGSAGEAFYRLLLR
jgi:class 3 adenylate cyclase